MSLACAGVWRHPRAEPAMAASEASREKKAFAVYEDRSSRRPACLKDKENERLEERGHPSA